MATHFNPNRCQRGAALITGLILLVALTIIGVVAISNTGLEQRMAANMADKSVAFNSADSALRVIEQHLTDNTVDNPNIRASCASAPTQCVLQASVLENTLPSEKRTPDWWLPADNTYWESNGLLYDSATDRKLKGPEDQPRYVAEYLQYQSDTGTIGHGERYKGTIYYRITARGTGITNKAEAVVQATTTRRHE